jgi:hypothetical protein
MLSSIPARLEVAWKFARVGPEMFTQSFSMFNIAFVDLSGILDGPSTKPFKPNDHHTLFTHDHEPKFTRQQPGAWVTVTQTKVLVVWCEMVLCSWESCSCAVVQFRELFWPHDCSLPDSMARAALKQKQEDEDGCEC